MSLVSGPLWTLTSIVVQVTSHISQLLYTRVSRHPSTVMVAVEAVRFDGPVMDVKELENEECDLVVETCVTQTLPPAVTLKRGLESIHEAVENLKMNPPCSSSGILRFQIAVPPSAKALDWFCCQPESVGVFPQFFLSKSTENSSCKALYLNGRRGVFGIGTAICFLHPSSCISGKQSSIRRYLSSGSIVIRTYGFVDVDLDTEYSSIKHVAGSFYFLIPEIELDEHEDVSILAVTLAWDDNYSCTFKQAVLSFELTFNQLVFMVKLLQVRCQFHSSVKSGLQKFNLAENKSSQTVRMRSLLLDPKDYPVDPFELKTTIADQFCFRLSPSNCVSCNMLDHASEKSCSLQDQANVNILWASLIVEECTRLGLTYFCLAPGSRSSPLAIAASTHPLTTCIACFDERSLAFHAVGFARGSYKPAVIITTSGTAVSNLFPAVVEASQDFMPLLLLTADRPPELQDAGANQSINQVNHYGSFVRFFFSLPAPTDNVSARMVLTTVDLAVHQATSLPYGPVHINCTFREPLHDAPKEWTTECLKGLDVWTSGTQPFTRYIKMQDYSACCNDHADSSLFEVVQIIQQSKQGLLLLGGLHTEDDIWAALLLAKHLNWPVVADILSGLRLRKLLSSSTELQGNILFVDHLDHALLYNSVRDWMQIDVIIQIGSRITSKRVSKMLEECYPYSYIMVDNHTSRHDPSHLVTHRVQGSILQFADSLLKIQFPPLSAKWSDFLQSLDMMISWDVAFQILTENSLTEPYVANVISNSLSAESALFIGNSMAIRDADMYGFNWKNHCYRVSDIMVNLNLPCHWVRVAGNRGASGIDGLLSSAIGFAVGCGKRVLCVIGDISFLHDTNGLAILNQRMLRKPMTILVINNKGGAIFSLLPIADRTDPKILNQYFYTSHNISIHNLCIAHGIRHLHVLTKSDLQDALLASDEEKTDTIIEVHSCIDDNLAFHSFLRKSAHRAADHALSFLSGIFASNPTSSGFCQFTIHKLQYSIYRLGFIYIAVGCFLLIDLLQFTSPKCGCDRIQLCAPPTSGPVDHKQHKFYRKGYILSVCLQDGSVGYGEVAPLEIHKENLLDVEEQLRFLVHVLEGAEISFSLPLLNGSFASWIWNNLGIMACSLFPSVRCGLEMALLNAIAVKQNSSLLHILQPWKMKEESNERSSNVRICALIDSSGTPAEVAHVASSLIEEGFTALKLKVGRRLDPVEDAMVIQEVRKKVGRKVEIRVDANRKWRYEDAIQFSALVKDCDLQYVEEPVQDENDIINYCEETGLPVALDETIDNLKEDPLKMLVKYAHPGIVAVVIKPSVVGGFEKSALIARWAQQKGKIAVISASFESGLSLSTYILFSVYLELQNASICTLMSRELGPSVAHGLGTFKWLKEDVASEPLAFSRDPHNGCMGASVGDAIQFLQKFQLNQNIIHKTFIGEEAQRYYFTVNMKGFSFSIKVHQVGQKRDASTQKDHVVVFLHGFLGTGDDWIPIMKAISGSAVCISIDLPGHGGSTVQSYDGKVKGETTFSVEIVAEMLYKLIQQIAPGNFTIIGYSMGSRLALHMTLRFGDKINGAVIISGSPGLKNATARKVRKAKDDCIARCLAVYGLQVFLNSWYSGELWESFRNHPRFGEIIASRLLHDDVQSLAKNLSEMSIGRQQPLWEDLKHCATPLLIVVGEKDRKFKEIAYQMRETMDKAGKGRDVMENDALEIIEVPNCGHAVHLENPLSVVSAVRQFLTRLN
ncbi:hypothetical protein K2173_016998 [Erythroxylum novogranatense]|uniref:Mandelate racemase/muconate lactonizing enzyme C-terminal domain-containing protein n=1 Tax=Erythroxylum novogranatense TaxID=1862640 RepID=A0AAV8U5F4_9ROSI|nr:hypothetical protein K2173_016998 [Erythroxylum novogranatense]